MKILSYNPGHDGAVAYLQDGQLLLSLEAEKDSNYRYSPLSSHDLINALGRIQERPDVVCCGGWWPREAQLTGSPAHVGYRGVAKTGIAVGKGRFLGKAIHHFSSSHERSHVMCAFGMSDLPKGTPCYALIWEGKIGAFYEIDPEMNITLISNVMNEPGYRYASIYGLADPTFPKNAPFSRLSDAGKLMALASFSVRSRATPEEEMLISSILSPDHVPTNLYDVLKGSVHYDAGLDDAEFRNFAGLFSDRVFAAFYEFASAHMRNGLPLVIAGGCGLNCDWNTKWIEAGLFSDVFVPPVANDSGAAIGTAIDAQFYYTGDPKVEWNVYSGLPFETNRPFESSRYDIQDLDNEALAAMLANDLILAWINGRYEVGPRALGNRSILAAPFRGSTRVRLNEIKQREQFRPIAPACLPKDAESWFGCEHDSPFMLFTHRAKTSALPAVTHVNGTARIQTVRPDANKALHDLLAAFKARTGYGVLCNTSLNFKGKGCINNIADLDAYTVKHSLDGFVIEGRAYILKDSERYRTHLGDPRTSIDRERMAGSERDRA